MISLALWLCLCPIDLRSWSARPLECDSLRDPHALCAPFHRMVWYANRGRAFPQATRDGSLDCDSGFQPVLRAHVQTVRPRRSITKSLFGSNLKKSPSAYLDILSILNCLHRHAETVRFMLPKAACPLERQLQTLSLRKDQRRVISLAQKQVPKSKSTCQIGSRIPGSKNAGPIVSETATMVHGYISPPAKAVEYAKKPQKSSTNRPIYRPIVPRGQYGLQWNHEIRTADILRPFAQRKDLLDLPEEGHARYT